MIDKMFAPLGEPDRLRALASYDLEDPGLRQHLDQVAEQSATRLGATAGMVSIVLDSAQYFAGAYGVHGWIAESHGTPAEWAFCAHAVLSGEPTYVVDDAERHPAHRDSPLVTREGTRAYAGAAIVDPGGQVLGMHCVTDTSPRTFSDAEIAVLRSGADEVAGLLDRYRRTVP